ncbi:MAG: ImmA/IrrE family metallo-endopeptidase [Pseudomonadota bacterium]|jgi:hypothetical protein
MVGESDWEALEIAADELFRWAGCSLDATPLEVASSLGIRVIELHSHLPGWAALARVRSEWRIYVRPHLGEQRLRWAIAHEVGEWALSRDGYRGSDREAAADALAARVIAPRRRFLSVLAKCGRDTVRLASVLKATESLAALRLGEVTGEPLALVTPESVRTRGAAYDWPTAEKLRELAADPRPGLAKARLRDDPRRVVIRAI